VVGAATAKLREPKHVQTCGNEVYEMEHNVSIQHTRWK